MKLSTLTLFLLFFLPSLHAQPSGMHPNWQIKLVKEKIKNREEPVFTAYKELLKQADSMLQIEHHAVENLKIPGFYSDKKTHREMAMHLQTDAFGAYSTALAYVLSGEKEYGNKALYFLKAWATINKEYAELDGSLVLSYAGPGLMIAAGLLRDDKLWKRSDKRQFDEWTKNVFLKASHSIQYRNNNSGDWSRFATLLAASYLRDTVDFRNTTNLIKKDLFDKIAPDGHMIEEVKREGKGLWYTYFSLAPLTASLWTIYNETGENLFFLEREGASVYKALTYLKYYVAHAQEWPWFKNPDVADLNTITGFWPPNLFESMKDVYKDSTFDDFAAPYRPVSFVKHHFAWTFPTLMPIDLKR